LPLLHLGDPEIPARIAANWEKEDWHFRTYAHGAIAAFRSPENAASRRKLIESEESPDLRIQMSIALLEMLPKNPATLEFVRQRNLREPEDTPIEQLDLLLTAVATMAGWDFPERAERRAQAIAEEERMQQLGQNEDESYEAIRRSVLADLSVQEATDLILGAESDNDDDDFRDEEPEVPFVRETPKIGRSDPCPCQSGKKYKKCCGKVA